MEKSSRILLALSIATIVTALAGTGAVLQILSYSPNFEKLRSHIPVPTWSKGQIVGSRHVGPQASGWTSLDLISNFLIGAVISSEDTSFFGHQGIDFHELREAIKKDLREKRWARGASTLTQQVIKNVYLSQEKTLWRKLREILWAWELDKHLSKSEILCFYLNMVQWGPSVYGIREAASHYFEVTPWELTARESAFLAMLLPAPEKYYVYFKKKKLTHFAKRRIEQILKVMNRMGYLTDENYESALEESLWGDNPETITSQPLEEEDFEEPSSSFPSEDITNPLTTPNPSDH